jgi:hypothetical protein
LDSSIRTPARFDCSADVEMAADDEDELFLSAYLVDEEEDDDDAAAAKSERANRRAAGDWDVQRILEHSAEKQRELCRQHQEQLIQQVPAGDEPEEKRASVASHSLFVVHAS